jgi:PAS domain S-box-containing protein
LSPSLSRSVTDRFFNRVKEPGMSVLTSLISLEKAPCALLDGEENRITFINSEFMKLCGYPNEEVTGQPIEFLFPELSIKAIASGEWRKCVLHKQNSEKIEVSLRFNYLDQSTRWLRVILAEPDPEEHSPSPLSGEAYQKLLEFSQLANCDNLDEAFTQSVGLIHEVTGAEITLLYQIDYRKPQLYRVTFAGEGGEFPEAMPFADSYRFTEVHFWTPEMRILTDLHQFGRNNGYHYIVTAPLRNADSMEGLIVFAGKGQIPVVLDSPLLQIITDQMLVLYRHYILIDTLRNENLSSANMINILNEAVNHIDEAVILLDNNFTIQHINPAAEWILGYSSQEVAGQDYGNILIGTDRLSPALDEARKGIPTQNIGKVTLNRRKGEPFPAVVKVLPVLVKENLLAIEILLSDISETENHKAVVEHLEHRAVLGDYTAAVVHDIRNPINNISLGAQRLGSGLPEDDPKKEIADNIINDCTRLNHLLESLLAYSRSNELHLEVIEVEPYLKRLLDKWHPRFANAGIKSFLNIDPKVKQINGDPRALDRVFTNLISNAVDAMSLSGDSLAINAILNTNSVGLPMVEITVSDNGPGIPEDMSERIFEPFVTTSAKGTGLGLTITKQIVTAHKGSISVKSFPGATHFIVCLPALMGDSE